MNLRRLLNRLQASVDELYNKANRGQGVLDALGDRMYSDHGVNGPTSPTTGSFATIAGMILQPRVTGIFMWGFSAAYTGATATDTVAFQVQSQTSAAAITFGSATNVTPTGANAPGGGGSAWVSDAAGGITFASGGGGGVTWWTSGTLVQGTGATTGSVFPTGILYVTPAQNCAILLQENLSGGVTTYAAGSVNMWAMELPEKLTGV
jgi:hypothetical protein